MKLYRIRRNRDTHLVEVDVVQAGQRVRPLNPRLDLFDHSPTGFEYGYGGSGPAQLALALLADAIGKPELAIEHHQRFKWQVIAGLDQDQLVHEFTDGEILEWARNLPASGRLAS